MKNKWHTEDQVRLKARPLMPNSYVVNTKDKFLQLKKPFNMRFVGDMEKVDWCAFKTKPTST